MEYPNLAVPKAACMMPQTIKYYIAHILNARLWHSMRHSLECIDHLDFKIGKYINNPVELYRANKNDKKSMMRHF